MKIGIFGGTFNPIHNGHLNLVSACARYEKLDKVIIIPTSVPSHKVTQDLVDIRHRLNMCKLCFKDFDGDFTVSDVEKNDKLSYTYLTLYRLKSLYPNDELYFIMGSDMLYSLDTWENARIIYEMVTILCMPRTDDEQEKIEAKRLKLEKLGARVTIVKDRVHEISSTKIKTQLDEYSDEIHESVYDYIAQNGLYNAEEYDYSRLLEDLKNRCENMLKPKRLNHTKCVAKEAVKLAKHYGEDIVLAELAAWGHDLCKELDKNEMLRKIAKSDIIFDEKLFSIDEILHGFAAAELMWHEMGIFNTEVLDAVRYHTTARADMSKLEKIIYIADLVSEDRKYDELKTMRKLAYSSLEDSMRYALIYVIEDLAKRNVAICEFTCDAYNFYL